MTMKGVLLLFLINYSLAELDSDSSDVMLDLEHSFDQGHTWQPRGHVSWSSGRTSADQLTLGEHQKQALKVGDLD